MTNLNGRYVLESQENIEPYLKALDVNIALRKIVLLLRPEKEFVVDGNHMIIRTLSTFRNYVMDFILGEEFEEDLSVIDGRICKTTVFWENEKLVCVQKGEVPNRGWKQWLDGDLLHVLVGFLRWIVSARFACCLAEELTARNAVSTQTFRKV